MIVRGKEDGLRDRGVEDRGVEEVGVSMANIFFFLSPLLTFCSSLPLLGINEAKQNPQMRARKATLQAVEGVFVI